MIPTVICAAPRTENIQQLCIESVYDAGFEDLLIYAEPGTSFRVNRPVEIQHRVRRKGEYHNWLASCENALRRRPTSPVLATAQDDVLLLPHSYEAAYRLLWPSGNCGMLHIYTSRRYRSYPHNRVSRLQRTHQRKMCAACFLLWPRHVLEQVVNYGRTVGWRGHTSRVIEKPEDMEGLDSFLGIATAELGYDAWVCNPSMGQHMAKESTLGHGGPMGSRLAAGFPGEGIDARTLHEPGERCAATDRCIQDL